MPLNHFWETRRCDGKSSTLIQTLQAAPAPTFYVGVRPTINPHPPPANAPYPPCNGC
ncbi:hypothetical protein PGTUg99_033200 [Puccinia graminis f. sp. tritici]|uniref:Uncharacterized protein n=1 Tax=Puccinia graminis f. sp. tritici TaxID=56615 RepID=A0A5B0QSW5_PUCGR|nr:hypothetical protein PGTUg99_033200 [Puccinia graminis f. sp. tritici]